MVSTPVLRGGKGDVIFNIPEGGVRTNFFVLGGYCLSFC